MDAKDIAEELQDLVVEPEDVNKSEETPPEKMLPASRVNELVKKAKLKGEQKMQEQLDATRQELEQLKAQQGQQQAPVQQQQSAPQQQGIDPAMLQQLVAQQIAEQQEQLLRKQHEAQLHQEVEQVAKQYHGKMAQGSSLYDDFDAITADFNPAEFPQLVWMANETDNTAAVIYELRKNPGKLAQLATLAKESPSLARSEMGVLSQSIKRNEEAKRNLQEPQDPLNRLKPSPAGTDNGQKTIKDLKSASFLKA
jgi:hypothetical protein